MRHSLSTFILIFRFEAVHDEGETSIDGSRKFYSIYYFLCDDCIQIKLHETDQEPARILLKKIKVPKRWTDIPGIGYLICLNTGRLVNIYFSIFYS